MSQLHQISGCQNAERKADVIFVHGLGGDAVTTWRHGKDETTSWPHWLGKEFPDVGVWSLGYAASLTKWARIKNLFSANKRDSGHSMALPDRALQVLDLMVLHDLGRRPVFFICHSLGGLLAKQILRTANDAIDERKNLIAKNTGAVLFLATPHAGGNLASLLSAFRKTFGATISIKDLRAHDAHLRELYNWYRGHGPQLKIETATYFESRATKGVVRIVNPTSAHPGVGSDPVALDEDHISISKPRSPDVQVCSRARDLLAKCVRAPALSVESTVDSPLGRSHHDQPQRVTVKIESHQNRAPERSIPGGYPPAAENFFGRKKELKQLTKRLWAGKDTGVVGPAGFGKTALAAEAIRAVVEKASSNSKKNPWPDGVVFLDLYLLKGQAELCWNALCFKITYFHGNANQYCHYIV